MSEEKLLRNCLQIELNCSVKNSIEYLLHVTTPHLSENKLHPFSCVLITRWQRHSAPPQQLHASLNCSGHRVQPEAIISDGLEPLDFHMLNVNHCESTEPFPSPKKKIEKNCGHV